MESAEVVLHFSQMEGDNEKPEDDMGGVAKGELIESVLIMSPRGYPINKTPFVEGVFFY